MRRRIIRRLEFRARSRAASSFVSRGANRDVRARRVKFLGGEGRPLSPPPRFCPRPWKFQKYRERDVMEDWAERRGGEGGPLFPRCALNRISRNSRNRVKAFCDRREPGARRGAVAKEKRGIVLPEIAYRTERAAAIVSPACWHCNRQNERGVAIIIITLIIKYTARIIIASEI